MGRRFCDVRTFALPPILTVTGDILNRRFVPERSFRNSVDEAAQLWC
jgi:hypothetical protein